MQKVVKHMIRICEKCNREFKIKKRGSYARRYCFDCNPFISHRYNTTNDVSKKCLNKCKRMLPNTEEYFIKFSDKSGEYLSSICRDCNRQNVKQRQVRKKILAMQLYGNNQCDLCGYDKNLAAIEFHHKDPTSKDGRVTRLSLNKMKIEIKKCILVCANCHREIHYGLHLNILKVNYSDKPINVYHKARHNELKKYYIDYLGSKCIRCGYNKCLGSLDFHHRDKNEKEFNLSHRTTIPFDKIKDELDKCDLLCSNCHRETHQFEDNIFEDLNAISV